MTDDSSPRDYRDTLFLPKTDFPMRAGLPKKEPEWLEYWNSMDLYGSLRKASTGRTKYILHDGPPYANGHIHMGTALNKILKDMVTKSHQMMGFDANYVPGWDCHGLPIEWKVEEEFRSKGRTKDEVPGDEFRTRCREYAAHWLDIQREEFKRLGVIGDWDNPYKTMNFASEEVICAQLLEIAKSGQLYRGSKPVMWSSVERTALAEAEVEYADRRATQIYVKFPVRKTVYTDDLYELDRQLDEQSDDPVKSREEYAAEHFDVFTEASVVIWTTTPWTIPANRAVSFKPGIAYGLYEVTEMQEAEFEPWSKVGDKLIVADDLWPTLKKAGLIKEAKKRYSIPAQVLVDTVLDHPLKNMDGADGKFDFPVPLLAGDHVTAEAGTGFVHTAPSHGEDDYVVWISNQQKLENLGIDPKVPMTLDDDGCYTDIMPERFQGLDVIRTSGKKRGQDGKANPEVIKALMECGNLLARGITTLRDAHSWRSKAPVIRRATPQWFISMSHSDLRGKALAAIKQTKWYPARGKNRITAMVEDRPDWLISRQRNWGVPITLILGPNGELHTQRDDADAINSRILAAVREHGVDGWFDTPLETLMPGNNEGWSKVTDILDVWFDSGCTHAFCLKQRADLKPRADLYLEGSDQHRGWFQSSLLESCAVYDEAPYDDVLTHGFVMAEDGRKMSKSLGNTVAPEQIIKQYGAEIMRLWVASSDFTVDLRIGDEIIKTNVDAYRKLRNTLRYMIGALDGYTDNDAVPYVDLPALEKWVLHRIHELSTTIDTAYREHDYKRVFSNLFNFCTNDLSAFYFDIRKDALYCDPLGSTRRLACRTVMDAVFQNLSRWLAPIMCFTMEEVWHARFGDAHGSVHMAEFLVADKVWHNPSLDQHIETLKNFRSKVSETIEPLRKDGIIKSSLEARIFAPKDDTLNAALTALGVTDKNTYSNPAEPTDTLSDYLIVSEIDLSSPQTDLTVADLKSDNSVSKCERSWKYFKPEAGATITPRDQLAVKQWDQSHG